MQATDPLNLIYTCQDGEQVTMSFTGHNTVFGIERKFDDEQHAQAVHENQDLVFVVNRKPNNGVTSLRVFFIFINQSGTGGSYDIELRGSQGGTFQDLPPCTQAGDIPQVREYTFVVSP